MLSARPEIRRLTLLLVAVAIVLWLGRDVLGPFVLAAALAYAFTPLVDRVVEGTGWPRPAVVGLGYAAALIGLALLIRLVAGPLLAESDLLARNGPRALAVLLRQLLGSDTVVLGGVTVSIDQLARALRDVLTGLVTSPGGALHLATRLGESLLDALLVVIVTFYMLLDGARAWAFALGLVPEPERSRLRLVAGRVHSVLGRWLRGTLLLVGLVALVLYLVLGPILHLPYALALAILTGILEVIPLVGPLIAAALAVIVAFSVGGPGLALVVAVVYLVVREVEDQLVMPVVIGRAVDLHPAVTIFAVLVGLSAFGILGGLLAVPAAAALNVTLREEGLLGEGRDRSPGPPSAPSAPSAPSSPPRPGQSPAEEPTSQPDAPSAGEAPPPGS